MQNALTNLLASFDYVTKTRMAKVARRQALVLELAQIDQDLVALNSGEAQLREQIANLVITNAADLSALIPAREKVIGKRLGFYDCEVGMRVILADNSPNYGVVLDRVRVGDSATIMYVSSMDRDIGVDFGDGDAFWFEPYCFVAA